MVEFKAILSVEEALIAVKRYGEALQYVPDELKTEAVVLAAVESDGYALQYVPDELKTEAVVLAAVKCKGYALQYVFEKSLFTRLAEKFEIPIDIKEDEQ